MKTLTLFLIGLVLTFAIVMPFTVAHSQESFSTIPFIPGNDPTIETRDGQYFLRGTYNVELKDETFTSLDQDPKFKNLDRDSYEFSSNPYNSTKLVPELKHENDVRTAEIVYDKIEQYNSTLSEQGGIIDNVYIHAIRGFGVEDVEDISVFVNDPDVESVDPISVGFEPTQYRSANAIRMGNGAQPIISGLRPDGIEGPVPNVQIGLFDGRPLPTHPDLNVAPNPLCNLPSTWRGCTATSPSTWATDHGTLAAGIMAAKDNLGGISGALAGAEIHSVVNCGASPSATGVCTANLVPAINWFIARGGIDVVHLGFQTASSACSRGSTCSIPSTSTERTALANAENAGIVVEQSAGNYQYRLDDYKWCDVSTVICTSAMFDNDGKCGGLGSSITFRNGDIQRDDQRASFSNFGPDVDIMASGGSMGGVSQSLSTSNPPASGTQTILPFIGFSAHGWYNVLGGTSESGPWVAGAIAAIKHLHPTFTPSQLRSDLLTDTTVPINQPCDSATGIGGLRYLTVTWGSTTGSSEPILDLSKLD